MPTVLKSGSLSLLEPSGPAQACNGIALPLYITSNVEPLWGEGGWENLHKTGVNSGPMKSSSLLTFVIKSRVCELVTLDRDLGRFLSISKNCVRQ
jgi:hypothetical protein